MVGAVRVTFGIPLSQVSRFHIQRRAYEWAEFKNVSLRRGVDTDARVEVEGVIGSRPRVIKTQAAGKERIDQETRKEKIKAKLAALEKARHRVERDLRFAEGALDEVRQRYGISDIEERSYPHPITSRLMRLEKERDGCIVEASRLEASIRILEKKLKGADDEQKTQEFKANLEKARDELFLLRSKFEQLQVMREEAAAKKRDLDLARVKYKQRARVRDERRRMLDSLKAQMEQLRIMHDDPEAAWPGAEGERR
jgi:hypothetical protein